DYYCSSTDNSGNYVF
nr:immunoglobulin light chain junction region [Macaca mulatta]MOV72937.1 immunoglobulin light chain junction region [Macaca mulatta]